MWIAALPESKTFTGKINISYIFIYINDNEPNLAHNSVKDLRRSVKFNSLV